MFKRWWRKHTLWGLRKELAELLNAGEQAVRDYDIRFRIHKIKAQRISADGYPATAREYLDGLQIPLNRWTTFSKPLDAYALTHLRKDALQKNTRIAKELIADIERPLPDVIQEVDTTREQQLNKDIQHLTLELRELTQALDDLVSKIGIPTRPVFLEIGRMKKEGFRLLSISPRPFMKQLADHRANLHYAVQAIQHILTQDLSSPSS
jgi:hypothetical protein